MKYRNGAVAEWHCVVSAMEASGVVDERDHLPTVRSIPRDGLEACHVLRAKRGQQREKPPPRQGQQRQRTPVV